MRETILLFLTYYEDERRSGIEREIQNLDDTSLAAMLDFFTCVHVAMYIEALKRVAQRIPE